MMDVFNQTRKGRKTLGLYRECVGILDRAGSRCAACLIKHSTQQKIYRDTLKHEAYMAYGGYRCVNCNETEKLFLCLDHVNGGGKAQVRELGAAGTKVYRWLKNNDYPVGYMQVLCYNCNHKKYIQQARSNSMSAKRRSQIRRNVLNRYSAKCECCNVVDIDILCFDHIFGGGNKFRCNVPNSGSMYLVNYIIKNNYPLEFRVLCHNCNQAVSQNGGHCIHV